MRVFNKISIKNKLRIIIILTSTVVIFLASIAFVASDLFTFRQQMVKDLSVLADLIGINSSAGLIFEKPNTVEENIAGLKDNKNIIVVHIFAKNGTKYASYFKQGYLNETEYNFTTITEYYIQHNIAPNQKYYDFHRNKLEFIQPIIFKNEILGTAYIVSDLKVFKEHLLRSGVVVIIVILVSLLLTEVTQSIINVTINNVNSK